MSAWVVRPIARFGGGTKDFDLPCGKPARAMEVKAAFPVSAGRKLDLVNGGRVVTVEGTPRQAVGMSNGDLTQPLELILPEEGVYPPLEDRQCCLAREVLMGVIHLGQEKLIFARVLGRETIPLVVANTNMAGTAKLGGETGQLCGRDPRYLLHVLPDQSSLRSEVRNAFSSSILITRESVIIRIMPPMVRLTR